MSDLGPSPDKVQGAPAARRGLWGLCNALQLCPGSSRLAGQGRGCSWRRLSSWAACPRNQKSLRNLCQESESTDCKVVSMQRNQPLLHTAPGMSVLPNYLPSALVFG